MNTTSTKCLLSIFVFMIILSACDLFNIEDKNTTTYATARIKHEGFDFSAGISDTVKWENNDGDIVNWSPVDPTKRNRLYYRPGFGMTPELPPDNSQKNMGVVPLDSIINIPAFDPDPDPLFVGNSYVVKCNDGYAKFKVLQLGDNGDGGNWWAKVEYAFTSGNKF